MGGQPRTGHQADRHDPASCGARDVDDFGFVKDRYGARLADLFGELIEPRLNDPRQRQGGERAHAEP